MPQAPSFVDGHLLWQRTHVAKTLWPPRAGTVRLRDRFGTQLVCVRYRHDLTQNCRYTTVELVIDQAPIKHRGPERIDVWVHFLDKEMRAKVLAAGGRWDRRRKTWRMARKAAEQLGIGVR